MTAPTAPSTPAAVDAPGTLTLLAPLTGLVVPLDRVPDPAFAARLAGDGASIDPLGDTVVAPCAGRVVQVHRAGHALTMLVHGLELIIHVGLDTVQLAGDGFTPLVQGGTDVVAGQPLLRFDADRVGRRARSLLTQVLVANMDRVASMEHHGGRVTAGVDVLLRVRLAGANDAAAATRRDETVTSDPVTVRADAGLHARPAAALVAAARGFAADLRLVKDGREANARSVVSIMALEVADGDAVTVVGRGPDARDAVAAIVDVLATRLADGHAAPPSAARAALLARPVAPTGADPGANDGVLRGVGASPGVAIGQVYQLRHDDVVPEARAADANHERRALDAAIAAAHLQLETLQSQLARDADPERAAIFAAHQELLEDPEVLDRAAAGIRDGATAAWAWQQAYTAQAERLYALRSELLAGRATDLRDVGRRVLHLLVGRDGSAPALPPDVILVAEDLTPSDAATLDRERVRGFCTTMGSATSHVAILARGLGIPAVAGIDARALDLANGTRVVLDGGAGTLKPAPSAAEEAEVARRQAVDRERRGRELAAAQEPATTTDGHRVEVVANIGDVREARQVPDVGGEGVGLLRTEFLFMDRRSAPDEEEQTRTYTGIATALGPERVLVIRTLDVGGDKPLPYIDVGAEANPFLGERGVRLTLARPELFRAQIRAVLRAAAAPGAARVALMFPMIATLDEWERSRALVEEESLALDAPAIQVGIMVETASAALLAERFARECDFFSVGTNDLTQYTLAMDRTNPRLAPQVDALDPAVLRLIELTVAGARAHGRWVGVCGALAGDPQAVPVLVGLGIDELSADVPLVPAVKARVRALSRAECVETARLAVAAGSAAEVRAIVNQRHGAGA